jgi:hypothetical protein
MIRAAHMIQNIVPWLLLSREALDVLVHPLTESNYDDHTRDALWLGTPVPLKLERLSANLPENLLLGPRAGQKVLSLHTVASGGGKTIP